MTVYMETTQDCACDKIVQGKKAFILYSYKHIVYFSTSCYSYTPRQCCVAHLGCVAQETGFTRDSPAADTNSLIKVAPLNRKETRHRFALCVPSDVTPNYILYLSILHIHCLQYCPAAKCSAPRFVVV